MTARVIEQAMEQWTGEPDRARGRPSASARLDRAQAVIESGGFSWRADLPQSLGGTDRAPSPTAMLLGALAGCAAVFTKDTLAPQLGIRIDAVRATASCSADARGLLGMDGAVPDLCDLHLDLQIESPDGDEAARWLLDVWQERCPVYLALTKPTEVKITSRVIDPYGVA